MSWSAGDSRGWADRDEESTTTRLIDASLATELARERTEIAPLDRLEGTLAYVAPEPTGA